MIEDDDRVVLVSKGSDLVLVRVVIWGIGIKYEKENYG
jgi:hypothetical protein